MEQRTVSIISDQASDHRLVEASLAIAGLAPLALIPNDGHAHAAEALTNRSVNVFILADAPNTEYLLRFAARNQVTASIVLLVDDADNMLTPRWRSLGALDCLERRDLDSNIARRILDYSAQLGEARQTVRQLSNRDPLTGTLNRAGFRAHLERSIERSQRYGARTGLLYIDIDRFTQVNDHYGEGAGDERICRIASRLLGKLRNTDSIARLGGDEFAVVLEDVTAPDDIESIAAKMLSAVSAPMALEQQQVAVSEHQ